MMRDYTGEWFFQPTERIGQYDGGGEHGPQYEQGPDPVGPPT